MLWASWWIAPIVVGAYHYGAGQERVTLDRAATRLASAEAAVRSAQAASSDPDAEHAAWTQAIAGFEEAIRLLPGDRAQEARRARLEAAKAKTHVSRLPEANSELELLVDELTNDATVDATLLADARSALASSQYYMTWLLRLEGAPRNEWEPKIEGARQNYRWLAENAAAVKDAAALTEQKQNLESAVRLARMDLQELQGLPLPSQ
jgi:hypothetical protein